MLKLLRDDTVSSRDDGSSNESFSLEQHPRATLACMLFGVESLFPLALTAWYDFFRVLSEFAMLKKLYSRILLS
jgi:hypothetical protein